MTPPLDVLLQIQRHGGALRELARELLRDGADVDDAVQETWVRVLGNPPRHCERIGGWLAAILRNVAFRLRRSESRRVRHEERAAARAPNAEEDHADRIARAELAHRLIAAVDALDGPHRDAIWQRFFEGRAPRDIAAASGVPLATVKSRLQRGLATLRERLGEREGTDWRAGLAAAFGFGKQGTTAAAIAGGVLMATWTKVTVAGAATAAIMLVMLWPADALAPGVAPQRGAQAAVATAVTSQRDASQQDAQRPERDAVAAAPQLQPASPVATVQAGPPGALRGRAVDAVTREPLAGVRAKLAGGKVDVDAPDPEVQTGADGAFEFAVRAGSTPLVTLARDDRVETRWGFLRIPSGHTEQVGDVALRRGRFVRGRVVADGPPVPAGTLITVEYARQYEDRRREQSPCEARSDAQGAFTTQWPLPFGPTTWRVTSDDFVVEPPVQVVIGEVEPAEVVLVLRQREVIRGIVLDEAGQPVAGIGIADHPTPAARTVSGSDGRFALPRLRPGDGPLATVYLAQTPGCEGMSPIADVAWGTADLRIVVKRTRPFALEVVDENGAPIEDFGVGIYRIGLALGRHMLRQGGHHPGGKLAVDEVVRGATSLRVMPGDPTFTPSEPFDVGKDEPLRVVLQRRMPLPVLVHSGDKPVQGVSVELLRERGGASANAGTAPENNRDKVWMHGAAIEAIASGRTDAEGRTSLLRDADLRNCVLRTRLGDEPPGIVRDLIAPQPGEPLRVELPRHGRITGRVELRGRPRDAVRVHVWGIDPRVARIEIGPDGAFELGGLQTGTYRVRLELRVGGRFMAVEASERQVQVAPGAAANVAFDLADVVFASVRGTVVGELPKGLIVELRRTGPGGGSELRASAEVGADGAFHVAQTLPGTFQVAFRLTGSNALVAGMLAEPLVIAPGEEARPRLHYAVRRLVVKLRRPDGSVVRGERVVARCGGGVWPEHTILTPGVDEQLVLDPAPLLPVEFRGWNTPDAWSAPVVMPPDRAELEVTVILPDGSR